MSYLCKDDKRRLYGKIPKNMEKFIISVKEQFKVMCSSGKLFRANISGDEIYKYYLESFPDGSDPVFRDPSSSEHNCNTCHNFIRRYGNIVSIDANGNLLTLFGGNNIPEPHKTVAEKLDVLIKSKSIINVFFETYNELNKLNYEKNNKQQTHFKLGIDVSHKRYTKEEVEKFGVVNLNDIYKFVHFHLDLPKEFVNNSGDSIESIMGFYRDKYSVFKRALTELSLDTLILVKDLINQGSLLDGTTHIHSIDEMIKYKTLFDKAENKDNWVWQNSYSISPITAKFGNTLIGTLCYEIMEGVELNKAAENWNKRVDPINYHKAIAPITKKQIADAQKFVEENGYLESFNRRLANIDDIDVNDIKHISIDTKIKPITIFDNIKTTAKSEKTPKFDNIEEVSIEKFMADILPTCSSVEVYLQNNHLGNLVTLTTTVEKESKPIFKWNNNFSWTFNGNLAGKSQIKEAVKNKGGKVDGVLRFSIMWGENDPSDDSDLDAHCQEPNGTHIYFASFKGGGYNKSPMTGNLDVDVTHPNFQGNKNVVENITFSDIKKMKDGVYRFWVNQFANRGNKGVKCEIEFNDEIHTYESNKPVVGDLQVAEVTLKNGVFSIKHLLPSDSTSKELWGLETKKFHKTNLICLSPNYWSDNNVGNKHYLFMLDGAKATGNIRGFHNENLLPDLLTHRKVMEVLGAVNGIKVNPDDKQLSGIGFNSTVRDEVVLKLSGSFNRVVKIKF